MSTGMLEVDNVHWKSPSSCPHYRLRNIPVLMHLQCLC
jgi:hypothetical protein